MGPHILLRPDGSEAPGADLHLHSNASDGCDPPRRVISRARAAGLRVVALTDHDTVSGLAEARAEAERVGLEFIDGLELSTRTGDRIVHILGHFIQPEEAALAENLGRFQRNRRGRMERMLDRLARMGVVIDREDFFRRYGETTLTRGQLMNYLLQKGFVRSKEEALRRYVGERAPAYIPVEILRPQEAVEIIRTAGGTATFAHPALSGADDILPLLVEAGLAGLEVDHPSQGEEARAHYLGLAERYGLVPTGGSDCHGARPGPERMGTCRMTLDLVERLRSRQPASV